MAGDDRHPGSAVSTTEPSMSELFAEARPIVQDLTATLLPGIPF
jgi:hypothetical protein